MTKLPDDRDMEQAVRSWLADDDERPADRNRQVGRIMGRVDETHQRRGAWRFLPFRRGAATVDEADDDLVATGRGSGLALAGRGGVAPSLMAVIAILALVVTSLALFALRPTAAPVAPGASPSPSASPRPTTHPADASVLGAMSADLWKGSDTDFSTALEVYAEDAVHSTLWLDEEVRMQGAFGIWSQMRRSEPIEGSTAEDWIRLPDRGQGVRRYFNYRPVLGGISCVVWIEDEQITRHDCILPISSELDLDAPTSSDLWQPVDTNMDPAVVAAREQLTSALLEGMAARDLDALGEIVAPDVVHHVLSANQAYTVEGFTDWASIMTSSSPSTMAIVDLPAPEGELRWADYSNVGTGTLCVFWAHEGRITRQDCVVPGSTSVPTSRMAGIPLEPSSSPDGT